jgi:hypothetical protein
MQRLITLVLVLVLAGCSSMPNEPVWATMAKADAAHVRVLAGSVYYPANDPYPR